MLAKAPLRTRQMVKNTRYTWPMAIAAKTQDKAPRERLMAAAQLFYTDGIRAVGVNRLLQEAQTPIMTLYRHFGSKEGLVEAFLVDKDRRIRAKFEREVEQAADTGRERVLAAFDFLGRLIESPEYRGCTFLNVAVEMGDQDTFVDIAVAHKTFVREIFARYLTQAGLRETEPLATQLLILMNGVFVTAQMRSTFKDAAAQARMAAEVLVDAALAAEAKKPTGPENVAS